MLFRMFCARAWVCVYYIYEMASRYFTSGGMLKETAFF